MVDCVFCGLSNDESSGKRIYQNDNFFSIFDVNPITEGHSLVISKKHFNTILDLPSSLGTEFLDCVKDTILKLMKEDKTIKGFNLVNNNYKTAGQIVPHFHTHLVPRRDNDGIESLEKK